MVLLALCFSIVQVHLFSSASLKSEFFNWAWKNPAWLFISQTFEGVFISKSHSHSGWM